MKLQKYSRVELTWIDSEHQQGWIHESEIEPEELRRITTIGYVLSHTADALTLVQSRSFEDDPQVDAIMVIPLVAVKDIKLLERKNNTVHIL